MQRALDLSTNRRVRWHELTDQSAGTVRVVLLDGLDELLRAARHDRGGYLQQVVEFQRIEAEQHRPVVFVVTSRTVVADRVDIPEGVAVVKLEEFDESRIRAWLRVWREANAPAIAAGRVRELTPDEALHQPDLVSRPLLLLMLALYAVDPCRPGSIAARPSPRCTSGSSTTWSCSGRPSRTRNGWVTCSAICCRASEVVPARPSRFVGPGLPPAGGFESVPELHDPDLYRGRREETKTIMALAAKRVGGAEPGRARWSSVSRRVVGEPLPDDDVAVMQVDKVLDLLLGMRAKLL